MQKYPLHKEGRYENEDKNVHTVFI